MIELFADNPGAVALLVLSLAIAITLWWLATTVWYTPPEEEPVVFTPEDLNPHEGAGWNYYLPKEDEMEMTELAAQAELFNARDRIKELEIELSNYRCGFPKRRILEIARDLEDYYDFMRNAPLGLDNLKHIKQAWQELYALANGK